MRIIITTHFKQRLFDRFGIGYNGNIAVDIACKVRHAIRNIVIEEGVFIEKIICFDNNKIIFKFVIKKGKLFLVTCYRRVRCGQSKWKKLTEKPKFNNVEMYGKHKHERKPTNKYKRRKK